MAGEIAKISPEHNAAIPLGAERIGSSLPGEFSGGKAAVREASVADAGEALYQGKLLLPHLSSDIELSVVRLGDLGECGPYDMNICSHGPFEIRSVQSAAAVNYPVLWHHEAKRERKLVVQPDSEGVPRVGREHDAAGFWRKSVSRLHINRAPGFSAQSLAACLTKRASLGGVAWPTFMCSDPAWDYPVVLWANTTLGLLSFWWLGTRQHLGRSILTKLRRPEMFVLNPRRMSFAQLQRAQKIFKAFERQKFLPAALSYGDQLRKELDKAVLVDLLGLPEKILDPLDLLRLQWCSEPSVHGGNSTRPGGPNGLPVEEEG